MIRSREGPLKAAVLWLAIGISCLPWLLGSGFLTATRDIPSGWKFLKLPSDLLAPLLARPADVAIVLVGGVLFVLRLRKTGSPLFNRPDQSVAVLLLFMWILTGYFAFHFLMPAASQFPDRMKLSFIGPCLLLQAIATSWLAEIVSSRWGKASGVIAICLVVWQLGRVPDLPRRIRPVLALVGFQNLESLIVHLDQMKLEPGTKLYSTPNHHLILTFYTGLPVASVAPVRKSFLDRYPQPIVLFEPSTHPDELLVRDALERAALKSGETRKVAVSEWVAAVQTYEVRRRISRIAARTIPPLENLPEFATLAFATELNRPRRVQKDLLVPMLRGIEISGHASWWPVFMYRFVGFSERMGDRLNYRDRLRNSTAELVKDSRFVVYRSDYPSHELDPAANSGQ